MHRWMTALPLILCVVGCGSAPSVAPPATPPSVLQTPPASTAAESPAPIQLDDVAAELGIKVVSFSGMTAERHFPTANGTGVGMIDFDLDGWPDVFVCQGCRLDGEGPRTPISLFQSRRGRSFQDIAALAGIALDGYSPGVSSADVNNDGFPDIHLTRVNEPFRLFVNNGDGTFSDRSTASGLNKKAWGTSAAWLDYDNDGNPDLYVCNYGQWDMQWHKEHHCTSANQSDGRAPRMYCGPPSLAPAPHFLFHSLGDGRFEEASKAAGVYREGWPEEEAKKGADVRRDHSTGGRGQGVVACDLNNDGLVDLYVANDLNENFVFLNQGNGKFLDATAESCAGRDKNGSPQAGMGVDAADCDGDGFPELFVTNFFMEYSTLYRNLMRSAGDPLLFEDVAEKSGVAIGGKFYVKWGTAIEDLDGDGWPDMLVVNGHVDDNRDEVGEDQPFRQEPTVWRNLGRANGETLARFEKLSQGVSPFFHTKHNSRGAAFGDLFNDGQVHVVVSHRDEPVSVLRNRSRETRSKPYAWTQLLLIGTRSSRDAVGARVEIHLKNRVLVRHLRGGRSYLSAHDPRITAGLGDAEAIEKFVVYWPSGARQEIAEPAMNRSHVVREPF